MKFSSALQFNSVPEWADYYLAYSNLKKLLYQIEKEVFTPPSYPNGDTTSPPVAPRRSSVEFPEDSTLLEPGARCRALFVPALNIELKKIVDFYTRKEAELYRKFHTTENYHGSAEFSAAGSSTHDIPASTETARNSLNGEDDDDDDESLVSPRQSMDAKAIDSDEHREELANQARDLFILLSDLKSYANLNFTGFSKILKKYDKVTQSDLKESYVEKSLRPAYPFRDETRQSLNQHILSVQRMYAELGRFPDMDSATRALRSCLREQVVWERNTVWRDMISQERKVAAVGVRPPMMVQDEAEGLAAGTSVSAPPGPWWRNLPPFSRQLGLLILCTTIFAILVSVHIFDTPEEQNCLALLVFASLLWATEALPLFVTALLIPFLVVLLRVLRSDIPNQDPVRLDAHATAKAIFGAMFSPVIMLLLGGFAIAAAMSKYNIAKTIASAVLSKAGSKPRWVLLMNMMVATVASMWISNVAAPVLCFSLIQPILRTLPPGSPFARCLIIGIALASNIGGMSSPISSPQNIIALDVMKPALNWGEWFAVALPVSVVCNILVWLFLLRVYKPADSTPAVHQARYVHEPFNMKQWFIILVTIVSIVLWCIESVIHQYVGDMGVLAIIPLLLFFGTGILTKEDFNNFLWTTIILAMGGIALGRAVLSSGLLNTIATIIKGSIESYSLYSIYVIFCALVLFIATFISHTVGALIILPVVNSVGTSLPEPHARLLVFGATLMCSGAMGLPVSGFPNMTAIMMEDETGKPYLTTKDFLKAGIPSSVIAFAVIITLGYGICSLLGF
ncbi:SPX domain-containing protein [Dimargaris cristalligena]|uniref:SPX domain-containing protein n=1 Tax=Dimargaris cristalligena TaxID=215637 RepID=A0A4Q0A2Y8_9FUNG|nr:SPX domain-containing protein [Dimargaris cristalligena]|eukprot:RKP39742.1 SPX domain-containing protein [Dimargaris cristalligena]